MTMSSRAGVVSLAGGTPRRGCEPARASGGTTTSAVHTRIPLVPMLSRRRVLYLMMFSFRLVLLLLRHCRRRGRPEPTARPVRATAHCLRLSCRHHTRAPALLIPWAHAPVTVQWLEREE